MEQKIAAAVNSRRLKKPIPKNWLADFNPLLHISDVMAKKRTLAAVFEQAIEPLPKDETICVAFSGGVDSVCLLKALAELRPSQEIHAIHVNHMLRGEAAQDAAFCRQAAGEVGADFHEFEVDVSSLSRDLKTGIEEAGRIARKAAFSKVMQDTGASFLLTGHHANDRAETFLLNLLRGAGIHGLSAMREYDDKSGILRPLLRVSKADIISHCIERGWAWVEDESNQSTVYDRNWIRNDIMPQLAERRLGVVETLNRAAGNLEEISDFMRLQAFDFMTREANIPDRETEQHKSTFFSVSGFVAAHPALQAEILSLSWTILHGSGRNFSAQRVKEAGEWVASCPRNGGKLFFGEAMLVNRCGNIGFASENVILHEVIDRLESIIIKDDPDRTLTGRSNKSILAK